MRILIAEDDDTCSLILSSMFKPYGTSVVVADGDAVIRVVTTELVKQQPFDLICLDIMMPGLDGQACLRCIRAIEQGFGRFAGDGTKILMTTALNAPESILTAFRSQCEGYLVKPIDRSRLTAQLASLGFSPS
ncbi:MAG TPA: response regulator [Planctomycetota bacterium]|nr:response regulator [Planctomycetota bacterium]